MKNFWLDMKEESNSPLLCLAPLANVTDSVFRHIIAKYSKKGNYRKYITYTEFISADGLVLGGVEGKQKLLKDLEYSEIERPIVAQFFSSSPEHMEMAARMALNLGFDGVDINMGCPDKTVEKQGAGAALIKNPHVAKELVAAVKRGVNNLLPVSVKTRLGYNSDELEKWLPELLEAEPSAIIIHARTRKEMSKTPAHWDRVRRAVEIRNNKNMSTLIIGNGDVCDLNDAFKKCTESFAEGAMLGRAIFGRPWLFAHSRELANREKLEVLKEHVALFDEKLGKVKSFAVMKKHFKAYIKDFEGSSELRMNLMNSISAEEAMMIIDKYLK
jgi:nifR3 family TIM-barrel protein